MKTSYGTTTVTSSSTRETVTPFAVPSSPLHGSSIGHLLRSVVQSVKTRRKWSKREKFLRALEKSGVDFAAALLLPHSQRSTETSSSRSSLSLSFSTSRVSQTLTITRCEDATRTLDRIERLQVSATVENERESVTLVTLRLALASLQREAPAQQQQPQQQQQLVLGKSTVVVICTGTRQLQQQRVHELTRPFDDFRRLRKILAFCVRRGRHEEEEYHENKANPLVCAYCSEVRAYVAQCWERPPLLETSVLSSMCVIRRGVLGSSLMHFVRLAKSAPVFPPQRLPVNVGSEGREIGAAGSSTSESPVPAPMCSAHSEIATILHAFFRLQRMQ